MSTCALSSFAKLVSRRDCCDAGFLYSCTLSLQGLDLTVIVMAKNMQNQLSSVALLLFVTG